MAMVFRKYDEQSGDYSQQSTLTIFNLGKRFLNACMLVGSPADQCEWSGCCMLAFISAQGILTSVLGTFDNSMKLELFIFTKKVRTS